MGAFLVIPSHHTSPSSVLATLVKMVFWATLSSAAGLVSAEVPGATPKNPASGLMARNLPSSPNFIQAMSSPTVSTFQPLREGLSMARLVFPQAEGKAAAMWYFLPSGDVSANTNMCSANQPSFFAIILAILRAIHFFPNNAFPPYPEPYDQIDNSSGKCTIL